MSRAIAQPLLLAALLAGASGCSPSLNWRDVQLGSLTTLLPCKPDTAARDIVLKDQTYRMEMSGCEAGGAVFAISRVQAAREDQAANLLATLREASLAQVQAQVVPPSGNGDLAPGSMDLQGNGMRADGHALQVRFKWLLHGAEVYQIAAYADHLTAEHTEPLLREARVR